MTYWGHVFTVQTTCNAYVYNSNSQHQARSTRVGQIWISKNIKLAPEIILLTSRRAVTRIGFSVLIGWAVYQFASTSLFSPCLLKRRATVPLRIYLEASFRQEKRKHFWW
ncbi:hypothetical protein ScPMuIL_017222 [Solemya velum]